MCARMNEQLMITSGTDVLSTQKNLMGGGGGKGGWGERGIHPHKPGWLGSHFFFVIEIVLG